MWTFTTIHAVFGQNALPYFKKTPKEIYEEFAVKDLGSPYTYVRNEMTTEDFSDAGIQGRFGDAGEYHVMIGSNSVALVKLIERQDRQFNEPFTPEGARYATIVFLEGSEAYDTLEKLQEPDEIFEYALQWDSGEYHDIREDFADDAYANVYRFGDSGEYLLSVNRQIGYVHLQKIV